MTQILSVGVAGGLGRMGRAIIQALREVQNMRLGATWEHEGVAGIGAAHPDAAHCIVESQAYGPIDVAIDFTAPAATAALARWCTDNNTALIVGTTGLDAEHHRALDQAAPHIAVVQAANMSVGVNVLIALVEQAARMLGPDFDLEVVETHHRRKKDAPSGTAMRLLDALLAATEGHTPVFERHGMIGERPEHSIGLQSIRGGDVVGEHTVYYLGEGERVELTHRATDRGIFARGALRAARWAVGQPVGRYSMADVLA
jgi:4-hydroxy-tetrahydrodipicolinate reductase